MTLDSQCGRSRSLACDILRFSTPLPSPSAPMNLTLGVVTHLIRITDVTVKARQRESKQGTGSG